MSKFKENQRLKYLKKTQEVNYQKEFKRADRIYEQLSQRGNHS
ncbi:YfhE family protein [Oceanobacillus sp. 143]|uniref:YfhE family protein n=1 Tax=Oceanobacillus zhaokaii TaxID=2052660 RepID=A0A345PEH8_9BACI|nr:YfhE family protein [Oceanobacillus zhaokaii]AXI08408.1 YfhE family protein [Oceanobacillus zhaokaii]QGS68279.1 YfhE family protein [Oceanobacillus sp. 143]